MKIPKATKLPSGNWRIGMMVDGQRISITAPTKQEAERRAAAIKGGASVEKRAASITLAAAIDSYIALKSAVLSPATLRGYRGIQNHRFPSLMPRDVRSLTKQDVQLAVNAEARRVSAKTVCNAYGLIRPVLKEYGVDVFGVRLPQSVKPIKRYLQPEDIGKLADAVRGDTCEIPILLAVWLGMRRSEILGLCWDCVDTELSLIHIRRAVVPDEHNRWVLKDTAKIPPASAPWTARRISWTRSASCRAARITVCSRCTPTPSANTSTAPAPPPGSPIRPSTACATQTPPS